MAEHNKLGQKGEALAVAELQKKGYTIVAKNWYHKKAEIDIIAKNDAYLVAVEVKTRSTTSFGNPQDFVNPKKIRRLVAAMNHFVIANDIDQEVRFDIIAITKNGLGFEIEHLESAFYSFD